MLMTQLQGPQTIILKINMLNLESGKIMETIEVKIIIDA
jgi:hypothetical protein